MSSAFPCSLKTTRPPRQSAKCSSAPVIDTAASFTCSSNGPGCCFTANPWNPLPLRETALRLISIGDEFGVHNGVAINVLHDDLTVKDANARFWPQAERLKAALLAAAQTGEPRYWSMAEAAAM